MSEHCESLAKVDYALSCIACGAQERVSAVPHRRDGKVAGILFFCERCAPQYLDGGCEIRFFHTIRTEHDRAPKG